MATLVDQTGQIHVRGLHSTGNNDKLHRNGRQEIGVVT